MKAGKQRGGVLFTSEPDIMPELVRFTKGRPKLLDNKEQAVIVEFMAEPSTVFSNPCEIRSILLKIVAIDEPGMFNGHPIIATPIQEFQQEVHHHQDMCTRSQTKFGCSIVPTILYADIYTKEEIMIAFPHIGQYVKGKVGLIFMERIIHDPSLTSPTLHEYLKHTRDDTLLPKARRLFIMLAQLQFFHNDFHLKNVVVTKPLHGSNPALLVIDFGRATVIKPEEWRTLNEKINEFNATEDEDLGKEILNTLYRIEYKGYNPDDYPVSFGWFKGPIAKEEEVTAPILAEETETKKCILFQKIPYKDREIIRQNGNALRDYPDLQHNKQVVMMAVRNYGGALEFAPSLRGDKEIVMNAVDNYPEALQFASPELRADRDVLRIALQNYRALPYAIHPEKELVLPHLRRDGMTLAYVPVKDKEMIMTAVSQNGLALQYVDKQDEDMVMAAVNQNGMALQYASAIMKATEEVVMAAVRKNGMALQYASAALRNEEEVVLAAILQNGRAIHHTTLHDPKIVMYASLHGHTPTDEEIKLVLTFLHREDEPRFKRQRIEVPFKEMYKGRIAEIERKTSKSIQKSIEKLNECSEPGCTISGGKNKKLMYGSRRKSRRTRTKSRHTRRFRARA